MKTIIKIALEERANLSIAEAVQVFERVGGDDEQKIREEVIKLKFKL